MTPKQKLVMDWIAANPDKTLKDAARALKMDYNALWARVERVRQGQTHSRAASMEEWRNERREEILDLLAAYPGITQNEISYKLKINPGTVSKIMTAIRSEWRRAA
jgi:DNA-binding CsgD family transcriptional regulator